MKTLGKLYIVATPIGNLSDITLRAIDILKKVNAILAEDTRHCARLLDHYQIKTKTYSMHNFNEAGYSEKILDQLLSGLSFALISDAGTPLISDPGWALVNIAKKADIEVIPIPGPCAAMAALSACGLPTHQFHFFGFLPAKSMARQAMLKTMKNDEGSLLFYESPHRLLDMLKDCQLILGETRLYCIAKELTKVFENIRLGSVSELLTWLSEKPEHIKGEFVVLIGPDQREKAGINAAAQELLISLIKNLPLKTAVKITADHYKLSKNELYDFALSLNLKGL